MKNTSSLLFRLAQQSDASSIVTLITAAYRHYYGQCGWTPHAQLKKDFQVDLNDIDALIGNQATLLLLCSTPSILVGCVALHYSAPYVAIRLLAVVPSHQNRGIGRQLLNQGQNIAKQTWLVDRFILEVLPHRSELITFYERNGFQLTGESCLYPVNPDLWEPNIETLRMVLLEKCLL